MIDCFSKSSETTESWYSVLNFVGHYTSKVNFSAAAAKC